MEECSRMPFHTTDRPKFYGTAGNGAAGAAAVWVASTCHGLRVAVLRGAGAGTGSGAGTVYCGCWNGGLGLQRSANVVQRADSGLTLEHNLRDHCKIVSWADRPGDFWPLSDPLEAFHLPSSIIGLASIKPGLSSRSEAFEFIYSFQRSIPQT